MPIGKFEARKRTQSPFSFAFDVFLDDVQLHHVRDFTINRGVGEAPTVTVTFLATAELIEAPASDEPPASTD